MLDVSRRHHRVREGGVLLHPSRVEAVDPEDRGIRAIADGVGSGPLGKLRDPMQAERAAGRQLAKRAINERSTGQAAACPRFDILRHERPAMEGIFKGPRAVRG